MEKEGQPQIPAKTPDITLFVGPTLPSNKRVPAVQPAQELIPQVDQQPLSPKKLQRKIPYDIGIIFE